MIEVTRPKLNRFKYAAMLLGAMAVAGTPLAYPAIATAEPNSGVWDIDTYDYCMDAARTDYQKGEITLQDLTARAKGCCEYSRRSLERCQTRLSGPARRFAGFTAASGVGV